MIRGQQAPLPFFEPQTDWKAKELSELPDSWKGARRVAIDIETRDEDLPRLGPGVRRKGCYIVGYSFAIEDGPAAYVPIRHSGGGNLDAAAALSYLRKQAKDFDGDVCGAGLQYDLDWLEEEGVKFSSARFFRDVQVAAPLINELELSYSLESIANRAGIPGKDETILREALASYGYKDEGRRSAKRGLWVLPAKFVGSYGEQDARLPLTLLGRLEREIDDQDLWRVYDLESRVLPVLVKMRRRGVRVSFERLEKIEKWSRERQAEALDEIARHTGIKLAVAEVTKPESLAKVLRSIGIEPPKTKLGKASVNKDLLAAIDHPVGKLIRRARQMSQLRSTFCNSIREHAIFYPDGDARIHCTFNQLRRSKEDESGEENDEGARFGRLSCTNPNLQQQPARDPEIGPMWRAIYLPERDALWGAHDYSQQEPRIAVHYAVKAGAFYIGRAAHEAALAAMERYRADPSTDFHDMMTRMVNGENIYEEVGKEKFKQLRGFCKEIYLGLSYGMGGAKLCRKLGLPTKVIEGRGGRLIEVAGDEGQAIIDKFNLRVPFVRATARIAQNRASEVGYIVTLSGRRCHFPKDEQGNYDWCHKAFNRLIQGASADQTKTALVALEEAGFFNQLQIHDEIDHSVSSREESKRISEIMETCCPDLLVPSRVDAEVGESWGEAA